MNNVMKPISVMLLIGATLFFSGCRRGARSDVQTAGAHEDLDATLWMRTSAEYVACCEQTYLAAKSALDAGRKDPTWSAIPSQAAELAKQPSDAKPLPVAVILDVDETVLDNSDFQVELIEQDSEYSVEAFDAWVEKGVAMPLPGVVDFIQYCQQSGVEVFYLTNRTVRQERATARNLASQGLMQPDIVDHLLTKEERDDWGTDKETRRRFLAERFRVLLMIGDDLNDFASTGDKPSPEARREIGLTNKDRWGKTWFMVPNADYGGWERALFKFDDKLPRAEKLSAKRRHLRPQAIEVVPAKN